MPRGLHSHALQVWVAKGEEEQELERARHAKHILFPRRRHDCSWMPQWKDLFGGCCNSPSNASVEHELNVQTYRGRNRGGLSIIFFFY